MSGNICSSIEKRDIYNINCAGNFDIHIIVLYAFLWFFIGLLFIIIDSIVFDRNKVFRSEYKDTGKAITGNTFFKILDKYKE